MSLRGRITDAKNKIVGSFSADESSITVDMKDPELQRTLDSALKREWHADVLPSRPLKEDEPISQWQKAGRPSNVNELKLFYAMLEGHNLGPKDVGWGELEAL